MKYRIQITQRNIDEGWSKSCRFCPVANAIGWYFRKLHPNVHVSGVNNQHAIANVKPLGEFRISKAATLLARNFDAGLRVKPLRFTLTSK